MKYSIEDTTLTALGDAVRYAVDVEDTYTPAEMEAQIRAQAAVLDSILMRSISGEYRNSRVTKVSGHALNGCSTLTKVILPKVTAIGPYAFGNCNALAVVDLSVATTIYNFAFVTCPALNAMIIRSKSVCTIQSANVFNNGSISKGTGYVYVPASLVDSYKADSVWATYANQIRAIEDYPDITGG